MHLGHTNAMAARAGVGYRMCQWVFAFCQATIYVKIYCTLSHIILLNIYNNNTKNFLSMVKVSFAWLIFFAHPITQTGQAVTGLNG